MTAIYALAMPLREKILYHEIYPPKLSIDIVSAIVAIFLYWQHLFLWGLAATFIPPILASVIVIRYVNLSHLRDSRLGRYVQSHMTSTLSVMRILANFVMLSGAWYHNLVIIFLGVVVILACWLWGLVLDLFAS